MVHEGHQFDVRVVCVTEQHGFHVFIGDLAAEMEEMLRLEEPVAPALADGGN